MVETFFKGISHPGLGRSRRVTAPNQLVLEEKIRLQRIRWDQQFQRVLDARDQYREHAKQYAIDEREQARQDRLDQKELAAERTNEAQAAIQALEETLSRTLSVDDRINWEAMKDRTRFSKPKPQPPASLPHPTEPMQDESRFQLELSFLDKVIPSRRASI